MWQPPNLRAAETLTDVEWILQLSQLADTLTTLASLTQAGKLTVHDSKQKIAEILTEFARNNPSG